ncbi:MAG: Hsp20/alpha crystallin family protein [Gammaproteobacteria bacterium]|nr:Hsp20/alpha crystallin family protein [Gammaproteobacteria bacterium]
MANNSKQPIEAPAKSAETPKTVPVTALSPFEEMERMFEGMFPRSLMRHGRWNWPSWGELAAPTIPIPRVDVVDRDDEIVVRAELAGVDKKDVDVSLTDSTVTIKGSTRREEKEEKGNYYRCEISRGSFARTVSLPAEVDDSKAKAVFKDGMLEISMPKKEKAKRHSITVQ